MFAPTLPQVRDFFCESWRKHLARQPLTPLEQMAADCVADHPQVHALLSDPELARSEDYSDGRDNPFLHLALHLALREQFSVDQPPGIRAQLERLARRGGDWHGASHEAMACLARTMEAARQPAGGFSPEAMSADYLERLRRA